MEETVDVEELAEIELSALGVDRFVKRFDYSSQEWAEIELSAQPARPGPLTEVVRQCLHRAGAVYLTLCPTGREFLKQQELTRVANWENIRGLAAELYERLAEANTRSAGDRKYLQLLKSLAKLRHDASISSAKGPPLSPREDYYREIFGVWVDKLGGALRVSRDSDKHKLGGPLVRFFQAVTRPVLATEAPALESISGIVDREKERRKERRKRGRQPPAQIAASFGEPAIGPDASGYYYTDLGPLGIDPDVPFDRLVHEYLVERGRATGVQHIVAIDVEGRVLAHGSGNRNIIGLPKELNDALSDPANKIVIHRTNLSNIGLQAADIACLAHPGLEAMSRHGNRGSVVRGALTPEARAMLRGNTTQEAIKRLYHLVSGIEDRLCDALHPAIRARKMSFDRANAVLSHLIGVTLRRAGILDYRSEPAPVRRIPRSRRRDGGFLSM